MKMHLPKAFLIFIIMASLPMLGTLLSVSTDKSFSCHKKIFLIHLAASALNPPTEATQAISVTDSKLCLQEKINHLTDISSLNSISLNVVYYGDTFHLPKYPFIRLQCSEISIRNLECYYKKIKQGSYSSLIENLKFLAQAKHLNDWGYYKLLECTSKAIFTQNKNMQCIFCHFMLLHSGYDSCLVIDEENDKVGLFIRFKQKVFGKRKLNFFHPEDHPYTQVLGSAATYGRGYRLKNTLFNRLKGIDLYIQEPPTISNKKQERLFTFRHGHDSLYLPYDPCNLKYYDDYPATTLDIYFSTPLPKECQQRLKTFFEPLLQKYNLINQAEWLLDFVQHSYKYQTDQEQFHHEKYNFPEESIYYETADCDDRSIFLAALIHILLPDTKIIGLDFPGHLCTAIHIPGVHLGDWADSIVYNGDTYFVADPTYKDARIGQMIPIFRQCKPEIIRSEWPR